MILILRLYLGLGRPRRGSVVSGTSSPTNSLRSSTADRPNSSNVKSVDSGPSLSSFVQEKRCANFVIPDVDLNNYQTREREREREREILY